MVAKPSSFGRFLIVYWLAGACLKWKLGSACSAGFAKNKPLHCFQLPSNTSQWLGRSLQSSIAWLLALGNSKPVCFGKRVTCATVIVCKLSKHCCASNRVFFLLLVSLWSCMQLILVWLLMRAIRSQQQMTCERPQT